MCVWRLVQRVVCERVRVREEHKVVGSRPRVVVKREECGLLQ